jgi:hypothetical protein
MNKLDLKKLSVRRESTVGDYLRNCHYRLDDDLVGLWGLVGAGRSLYRLENGDLREFIILAIIQLLAHGAHVIDAARDPIILWEKTDRYGKKPEDIAFNIVKEWNDKGEPDIRGWDGIAFAKQEWLDSENNRRDV